VDLKVHKALQDLQELVVHKVSKELVVHKVHKVLQDLQDLKVHRVRKALADLQDLKVHKVKAYSLRVVWLQLVNCLAAIILLVIVI
jgi:hypothetical protein